jgi:hypothetical protein
MASKKSGLDVDFHETVGVSAVRSAPVSARRSISSNGVVILIVATLVVALASIWAYRLAMVAPVEYSSAPAGTVISLEGKLDDTARQAAQQLAVSPNQDLSLQRPPSISAFQNTNQSDLQSHASSSQFQETSASYNLQGSVGTAATR